MPESFERGKKAPWTCNHSSNTVQKTSNEPWETFGSEQRCFEESQGRVRHREVYFYVFAMTENMLTRYIQAHNHGVRSGDFSQLLDLFAADASMSFHGLPRPLGPFNGHSAIAEAFAAHPPDDELVLDGLEADDEFLRARYRWRADPDASGGRLRLRVHHGRIVEVIIHIDRENPS